MLQKITWEEYDALAGQGRVHTLVDVREDNEWAEGHAPNAVHIPLAELASRAAELLPDTSATIVTCCKTGGRAGRAAEHLVGVGYQNVAFIVGEAGDHYR